MAKGRSWRNRLLLLFAVSTFTLLIIAGIMPNPFPPMWEWINRDRPIAAEVDWQERLGGRLSAAAVPGDTIIADAGRKAVAFDRTTGEEILEWTADWVTVAGTNGNAVVITGETLSRGYDVRDPATGTSIHTDPDARAVWGFRQARIDLRCDGARSCELRAYRPDAPTPAWTTDLPGAGSGLFGADPALTTASVRVPTRMHERVGAPEELPLLLGVPIDRRRVAVVHSATGELLDIHDAGRDELIMVVGDRVLRSTAARRDGVCQLAVTGHDAFTGNVVWGPHPYNLRTITGGGCEQEYAAVAAGAALIAVDPEGKEFIIDAGDGRVLWQGEPGERVQGLTEDMAVVKGADPAIRYAIQLGPDPASRWEQRVDANADVMIVDCGVVVADREPSRFRVWDPGDGSERISVRTTGRLLACAPDGLVLASGRNLGFAPFDGARGEPGGAVDDK